MHPAFAVKHRDEIRKGFELAAFLQRSHPELLAGEDDVPEVDSL